jgi:hypothetical protein
LGVPMPTGRNFDYSFCAYSELNGTSSLAARNV